MIDADHEFYLQRFLDVQADSYTAALEELRSGKKRTHWVWYIFPQLRGLGRSATSNIYGIANSGEARAYLNHPILGARLWEAITAMLSHRSHNAEDILGQVDAMKFKSCLALFSLVESKDPVFVEALNCFFNGERDSNTIGILVAFEDGP